MGLHEGKAGLEGAEHTVFWVQLSPAQALLSECWAFISSSSISRYSSFMLFTWFEKPHSKGSAFKGQRYRQAVQIEEDCTAMWGGRRGLRENQSPQLASHVLTVTQPTPFRQRSRTHVPNPLLPAQGYI